MLPTLVDPAAPILSSLLPADIYEEESKEEMVEEQESFLMVRSFESSKDFMKSAAQIIAILDLLADYNLKFQSNVGENRAKTMKLKKDQAGLERQEI